jgi:alpha-galactosidase
MNEAKHFPIHQTELGRSEAWLKANLLDAAVPPFSFVYAGRASKELIPQWVKGTRRCVLDAHRLQYEITYLDPGTRLLVTCTIVQNTKFPQIEWTVRLKNTGTASTPIIEDIQGIDALLFAEDERAGRQQSLKLYHFKGDYCTPDSYLPMEHLFVGSEPASFHPYGGRPTNAELPYYKLQGTDNGVIFVLSWQGQWETTFAREVAGVRVRGGQQLTHLTLRPGEEVRTPMPVLMFYDGTDYDRSVNMWRRWFLEFNIPRVNGELIRPFYANYSGKFLNEMVNANEENQIAYANKFLDRGIAFDYLWMDAGWYDMQGRANWGCTGTWKPDYARFPRGLRAISDYVHSKGVKTIVWFEPERVRHGTELFVEHADMLLPLHPDEEALREHPSWKDTRLLNLSDPAVVDWIGERICALIKSEGIDLYRQDFNIEPLEFWRSNDAPDRQGITENHYCTGYLRLWDRILKENPGIVIDSCASGGRRNDLETLRRALPLHKTDYNYGDLATKHGFHHTLFQWMPFFGSMNWPGDQGDVYYQRSSLLMSFHGSENVFEDSFDFRILKEWMQEWRETAHCMYGDYYALTPFSRNEHDWIGWQFNLPESGEGMVQMFMRPQTPHETGVYRLRGLDPESTYEVKSFNNGSKTIHTGRELMEKGLVLTLRKRPDSALLYYRKKD